MQSEPARSLKRSALFYVTAARACKRAHLFNGSYHHALTGKKLVEPSRFLTEAMKQTLA
ncbi:hypothetical protein P3T20_005759 [Paraburkholderia sp. GAS206C]|uniref:hypothetical protein n=1 Tax=unclassified Paraburkholderia TaxID=2615204 RepID=UPI003D1F07B1